MKFITSEKVKNIWFFTDEMGMLLNEARIPFSDVIKLPDYSDKLAMNDIITVASLQLFVAKIYGKTFISPFTEAKVNEIFTAKFKEVIDLDHSINLSQINSRFNRFYIRSTEEDIFIGMSNDGNKNTFFNSSNSFTKLNSVNLEKAMVEAVYKSFMYQNLHFQKNIIVNADQLCFTDILACLGKVYH